MSILTITAGVKQHKFDGGAPEKFVALEMGGESYSMSVEEARTIAQNIMRCADEVDKRSIEELERRGVSGNKLSRLAALKALAAFSNGERRGHFFAEADELGAAKEGESRGSTITADLNSGQVDVEDSDDCGCPACTLRRMVVKGLAEGLRESLGKAEIE